MKRPNHKFFSPIFGFLFLSVIHMNSQNIKVFKGKIEADTLSAENINVVNINLERGTMSDTNGNFTIAAALNDTIVFSSVQFQNKKLKINKEIFESGKIEVKLIPAMNELEEVRISDIKLTGDLEKDIDSIVYFDRQKFGLAYPSEPLSQPERNLYTATHSAGGIPLDLIINSINGKIKMLKKFRANDEKSKMVQKVYDWFGDEFFMVDLGLPFEEIENFLYYCSYIEGFENLVKNKQTLELTRLMLDQKAEFKEIREIK